MTLFRDPAEHEAAGHPSTWTITGRAGCWLHVDGTGAVHHSGSFKTRKAAQEALDRGHLPRLYEALTSWYAGGPGLPGWKPYTVVLAERTRRDAFNKGWAAYSAGEPRVVPPEILVGYLDRPGDSNDLALAWYRGWDRAADKAAKAALEDA